MSLEKENTIFLEIIIYYRLIYSMNHQGLKVSNVMEKFIGRLQRSQLGSF